MAVNLAAPSSFFLPFSSSSSTPLQIHHNSTCALQTRRKFHSLVVPKHPIASLTCANASVTSSTAAVSAEKEEVLPPLDVSEINRKSKKWVWKGYTISYLVYPEGNSDAAAVNPPLLLVHGFGASIAHWRRYTILCSVFFFVCWSYVLLWPFWKMKLPFFFFPRLLSCTCGYRNLDCCRWWLMCFGYHKF